MAGCHKGCEHYSYCKFNEDGQEFSLGIDVYNCTCKRCNFVSCEFRGSSYNIDGDCLWEK